MRTRPPLPHRSTNQSGKLPGQLQVIERPYFWPMTFVLAANGQDNDTVQGEPDIDFYITHLGINQTGDFRVSFTHSGSNATLMPSNVLGRTMLSLMDRPGMLPRPILLNGSQNLRVDIADVSGLANTVELTFIGYRRFLAPR